VGLVVGLVAAAVLGGIGALHVSWARGGCWPYADEGDFRLKLLPPGAPSPGAGATWAVAALLTVAAVLVAGSALGAGHWVFVAGSYGVVGVLALRGVGGLVVSGMIKPRSPFARMDRRLYSPLCVALAVGALLALGA